MARVNQVFVGVEFTSRWLRRGDTGLMLDIQEEISRVCAATGALRRDIARTAVKEYFRTLGGGDSVATGDFDAACDRAMGVLRTDLFASETMAIVTGDRDLDEQTLAGLKLGFEAIARPLQIPRPPVRREMKVFSLAIAALVGAAVGMLALAPLLRWAYDMRDLGLVLGGPAGALLAVLVVYRLSRLRLLLRFLPGLSLEARSLSGPARKDHETVVHACIEQWLDWAIPALTMLCLHGFLPRESGTKKDAAFKRIGKLIYTLHGTPRDALPVVADELIQEAKNYGFEGLDGPASFSAERDRPRDTIVWNSGLGAKYETFGHIVEGDRVTVERSPVVFEGEVVERGLVRKIRETA